MRWLIAVMFGLSPFWVEATVSANEQKAWTELLQTMRSAKEKNERYYLRNVTIETIVKNYLENGDVKSESHFRYIAGVDKFLQKMTECWQMPEKTALPLKDIIIGTPQGIYRITADPVKQKHILRNLLVWNDLNFYQFCRSDDGLSLPIADLDVPVVDLFQKPDMEYRSHFDETWHGKKRTKVLTHRNIKGGIEGNYFFDSGHDWVYLGNEKRNLATNAKSETVVSYHPDGTTPWKMQARIVPPDRKPYVAYTAEVTTFLKEPHSDSEFAFRQFGFPEPNFQTVEKSGVPTHVWLAATAMGCGLLGIGIRIIVRHLRTAQGRY